VLHIHVIRSAGEPQFLLGPKSRFWVFRQGGIGAWRSQETAAEESTRDLASEDQKSAAYDRLTEAWEPKLKSRIRPEPSV